VAAKSRQFTADKTGKGQFRSSPQRVASVSNLCNSRSQGAENMGNGECCFGFVKRVCPFISEKSSMTGDPLEA